MKRVSPGRDAGAIRNELLKMARIVGGFLDDAFIAFNEVDIHLADSVIDRDDQIDAMNVHIVDRCFDLNQSAGLKRRDAIIIRSYLRVSTNLEKLADYAVNIAKQTHHLPREVKLPSWIPLFEMSDLIKKGLDMAMLALIEQDLNIAKEVCMYEVRLDSCYKSALKQVIGEFPKATKVDSKAFVTCLLVLKYAENMGDVLANLGELSVYSVIGEKMKIHQFLHMNKAFDGDMSQSIEAIWGGKSGARVFRIEGNGSRTLVLKEGESSKISQEAEKIKMWNKIVPEIASSLTMDQKFGTREVLVTEHINGKSFEEIFFLDFEYKKNVLKKLLNLVNHVWKKTIRRRSPKLSYVDQIMKRLPQVFSYYPELQSLRSEELNIFGIRAIGLEELLKRAQSLETKVSPPFEVWIHGDFNTNNIFYDQRFDNIKFIDVHRSGFGDYLQDIAVMIASNLRNPVLMSYLPEDAEYINASLISFYKHFAIVSGDNYAEMRFMLALARALITSSRIVDNLKLARYLFLFGVFYLEKFVKWKKSR